MKLTILASLIVLTTTYKQCDRGRCQPRPGSKDYAVLLDGTIRNTDYAKTTLVSIKRTMRGFKHLFVTEEHDIIQRYLNCRCEEGRQYWVYVKQN